LSGQNRTFLGSVDLTTGAATSWAPPPNCPDCSILSLTAGFGLVYGAVAGVGGRASAWNATTGVRRWSQYGDGDVQVVALVGDTLYAGGHFSPQFGALNGSATYRDEVAAMDAVNGTMLPWAPTVSGSNGVWAIAGDSGSLWIGGGYTRVANQTSAGRLTRFAATTSSSPSSPAPTTVLSQGATWAYNDSGQDLGTSWRQATYNDNTWPRGRAQVGYGDGDEATVVAPGRLTYYLRTHFTLTSTSGLTFSTLRFLRDDGIVVYLNGTEVFRDNMPSGTITADTRAVEAIAGNAESTWYTRAVSPSLLRVGDNVLAVEVHNDSRGSSDISFDAWLQVG
jgi:hypothetical protein